MLRIPIRSRLGNAVLGVLGALYLVSATVTLVYYLVTNWGANGLIDRVLQLALLGSAITGLFFVFVATENLGIKLPLRGAAEKSQPPRDHRTAAATEP